MFRDKFEENKTKGKEMRSISSSGLTTETTKWAGSERYERAKLLIGKN
jgi:hypothetical protein